jgi:hypothetical protein
LTKLNNFNAKILGEVSMSGRFGKYGNAKRKVLQKPPQAPSSSATRKGQTIKGMRGSSEFPACYIARGIVGPAWEHKKTGQRKCLINLLLTQRKVIIDLINKVPSLIGGTVSF